MIFLDRQEELDCHKLKLRGNRNRRTSEAMGQAASPHGAGGVSSAPGLLLPGGHLPAVALAHNIPPSLLSSADILRRSHPPVYTCHCWKHRPGVPAFPSRNILTAVRLVQVSTKPPRLAQVWAHHQPKVMPFL